MKKLHIVLLVLGLLVSAQGLAANAQQEKMASCNAQAGTRALKGEPRQAFMSTCLKAEPATQQQKMTLCNSSASAQSLKGDARQQFMSNCLKKKQ